MVRTNQGGSVLSFVIIGVVMVALLVGGAYYVQQQTVLPAMEPSQPAPQPEQEQPEKSSDKDKSTKESSPQKEDTTPEKQPQTTPPRASSDTELPRTGPAELLATLLALGLLSATAVSYLRSRRPELSL